MPKARRDFTPLAPVMGQLKDMASRSVDALLLADGPVNADHALLDLCAEALHHLTAAEDAFRARDLGFRQIPHSMADKKVVAAWRARDEVLMAEYCGDRNAAVQLLRNAKKIKASTPAGIYAKALLVRCSRTGAAELAMSLASDMVDCPALRAVLWPVREEVA
jgi:hypothetical protein